MFTAVPDGRSHEKTEDVSLFLCTQMVTEEGSEWVRGKQGREEVGENGSGRRKDESGEEKSGEEDEKREREQKKQWEEESREGMTAIMCLRE